MDPITAQIARVKTDEEREATYDRIVEEFRARGGRLVNGKFRGSISTLKLYERRLLQLVKEPAVVLHPAGVQHVSYTQCNAWEDLILLRSPGAVRMLIRDLRSPNPLVRIHAAQCFAEMGGAALIPKVVRLIQGRDIRVARGALAGLRLSGNLKRAQRVMFPALEDLVTGKRSLEFSQEEEEFVGVAIKALCDLDLRRAVSLFTSSRCLYPGNLALRLILLELGHRADDIPRRLWKPISPSLLWPIYQAARSRTMKAVCEESLDQIMGQCLVFSAELDPERTRREAQEFLRSCKTKWQPGQEGAKAALRRCKKVPESESALRALERDPKRFSSEAAGVLRAFELAAHVCNDGFALYFDNLGIHWKAAHAGLKTLGLEKIAAKLVKGASLFGPKAPLLDPRRKVELLETLTPAKARAMKRLDGAFDDHAQAIFHAVEKYMLTNAPLFQSRSAAR